ncbi:uroporphyrinogen-III synthase [Limnochorda pilosa]|uniref:Uroporphyrinogen-III synthase n=1 Tax=Limnochorda pilosa TaxID=1555112 RepID=A0A0K2SPC1_LIMPI|nr:uroporphyrinogen-III synthase [Limnochorda pilosa]BAS28988.1 uroporphyrinogen-III synthase [Limnochorda pilosa]
MGRDAGGRLRGQTVLVTRSHDQAAELVALLETEGATVRLFPTIEVLPAQDPRPLEDALRRLDTFRWLVLTSPNGVGAVQQRLADLGKGALDLARLRVAAVGPGTARALRAWGVEPDLVPERFETAYLAEALAGQGIEGEAILVARSPLGSPELVTRLRAAGARVTEVEAYRVATPREEGGEPPEKVREALDRGELGWVTLTSPSTATGLVERLGGWRKEWSGRARVACIGPVTARRCRELGLPVDVEAPVSSVRGLVDAMARAASMGKGGENG